MKVVEYTDYEGIPHRVAIPEGEDIPPEQGIPVSLDLDMLYEDLPVEFRKKLYVNLWQAGLITACDYTQPGASETFRRAFLAVIRSDFMDVLTLAREVCNNERD